MTPLARWLKPPQSLLLILSLVTLVSVCALGFFAWRLLDQERVVEAQREQERLEQSADRIAAIAGSTLAETGERLGGWLISSPPERKPEQGLLLKVTPAGITVLPGRRLLYQPTAWHDSEEDAAIFAEGEALEFQQALARRALDTYRHLADSHDPAVAAGALMRIARVLRKSGRVEEAKAAYAQLASLETPIAGVPAELIARHALAELSSDRAQGAALKQDLLQARWPLARAPFLYYWSEAGRISKDSSPLPAEALALADAVSQWWREFATNPAQRGQATIWSGPHSYFVIWRGVPDRRAMLVTTPESLLKPLLAGSAFSYAALDSEGRVVSGKRVANARAAVRTPAETRLPWTLYLTSGETQYSAGLLGRQRFLLFVTAVMSLFLVTGSYLIARAIRREIAVARMQSDFVSAVSHEFRSPLTSIRQLSEILALGRIPNEQRRQVYYETLVRESTRLQRLIEGLLNFGRMEAGVRQYRFEPLDAGSLVSRVAAEFEPQVSAAGRHIEIEGLEEPCVIEADPEALSVALRNLVDNALKYAPDCPTVRVQWAVENSQVAISVRDRGPGIPADEKKAIFRKFVRGSAALAANVKGSGVGLAMVHHIVAAHGGNVSLASEPGSGSVFTILLPLGSERMAAAK